MNILEHSKDDPILQALTLAGLSENDISVYRAILGVATVSARDIAKETNLSRTMAYYVINRLLESGLIREAASGTRTLYAAEPPEAIEQLIEKQESTLKQRKSSILALLPNIRSAYNLTQGKPGVHFFEGKERFREALHETLESGELIRAFVDTDTIAPIDDINRAYVKERRRRGIQKRLLLVDTQRSRDYIGQQGSDPLTVVRFLSPDIHPFGVGMEIYDGRVAYFSFRNDTPIAFIVSDPNIFAMHRELFDSLWEQAAHDSKETKLA